MYDPGDLATQPIMPNMSVGFKKPKTDVKVHAEKVATSMGHPPSKPPVKKSSGY